MAKAFKWTQEQTERLEELSNDTSVPYADIVRALNREFNSELSYGQVIHKAKSIGCYKSRVPEGDNRLHNQRWLDEYDDFLHEYGENHSCNEIAEEFNRRFGCGYCTETIRARLNANNIQYIKHKRSGFHTTKQIEFILAHGDMKYDDIAEEYYTEYGIRLSRGSIYYVIKKYGGPREPRVRKVTPEHIDFIRENAESHTRAELISLYYKEFDYILTDSQLNRLLVLSEKIGKTKPAKSDIEWKETTFLSTAMFIDYIRYTSKVSGIPMNQIVCSAVEWFYNNDYELSEYVRLILHKRENSKKKNVPRCIRMPVETHEMAFEYADKYDCTLGDVMIQSIYNYCTEVLLSDDDNIVSIDELF